MRKAIDPHQCVKDYIINAYNCMEQILLTHCNIYGQKGDECINIIDVSVGSQKIRF